MFQLKQFHVHSPSKNHISGKPFPMEVHFVHADQKDNLPAAEGQIAMLTLARPEPNKRPIQDTHARLITRLGARRLSTPIIQMPGRCLISLRSLTQNSPNSRQVSGIPQNASFVTP